MTIAFAILILCAALILLGVALGRCPLVRALTLSFDCWAERTRSDVGELG